MADRVLKESTTSLSSSSSKPHTHQFRRPLGNIENNSDSQPLPTVRGCFKFQSTTTGSYRRRQEVNRLAAKAILPARPRPAAKKRRALPVASTDPYHTRALWDEVMSATRSTKSSEGKKVQSLGVSGRGRGKGAGTGSPRAATSSSTAASETGSQSQTRSVFAKPSDNDFYELVLLPRGIVIDGRTPSMLASAHFSTTIPKGERREYYQEASGGEASRVWLEKDEAFVNDVIGEYDWMTTHNACEAEFALYGKETLIRRETPHRPRDQRLSMTHRMVELVTKPKTVDNIRAPPRNPTPWWSPPLLDPHSPTRNIPMTSDPIASTGCP